jgi:hypothetical protein
MDSVSMETTIVGHIAGRLHPDSVIADRQQSALNYDEPIGEGANWKWFADKREETPPG